jgi:hypothetical protein
MCSESLSQCSSFSLLNPADIFLESGQSVEIPLKFDHFQFDNSTECRLNETIRGLVSPNNICFIPKVPEIINSNNQKIFLSIYQNNISIGLPIELFIYRCDLYSSCDQCNLRLKCSWCQGRCLSKSTNPCSRNEQCTSLYIKDFSPKLIPLNGKTIVQIYLNEHFTEKIIEILLTDIPCLLTNSSNIIQCQSGLSNSPRKGQISIQFENSIFVLSKETIEYRQSSIISINPNIVYEYGGQILHINGQNLFIGNERKIFIGNYQCLQIEQRLPNILSCRLPSIQSGIYNITVNIDHQIINTELKLKVTPNPVVEDIDPTISFAR